MKGSSVFLIILLIVVAIVLKSSIFIVEQPYQAIIIQLGEVVTKEPIKAGLHFKVPFIQDVVKVDKRILNLNSDPREVIAADQKRLIVNYYVKYIITDPVAFYKSVRNEMILANRLGPIVESQVREQIGFVSLISLLKESRSDVMTSIKEKANINAKELGVEVIDVRIKKTDLPEENSNAIFRRMQTEREKEAKEIRAMGFEEAQKIIAVANKESKLILSEAEKESQILKGQGDEQATKIFNQAFSVDKDFFEFYRHMQSYKKSLLKNNTRLIIPFNNSFLKYLNQSEG